MRRATVLATILSLTMATAIQAATPQLINYQGRLTDAAGDPVPDMSYLVKFVIYDAPVGGAEVWNAGFQTINTVNGLFTYQLGSAVNFPNGIFSDTNRYLGVTILTDPEITPRTRLVSTSYAFKAEKADLALDADSLGGSDPAFYLDWNNMINIPAGFADGVDDELTEGEVEAYLVGDFATIGHEHDASTVTQDSWTTPSLEFGWVNFDTTLTGTVGWFQDINGVIHLRGFVKDGVVASAIFTLPPGARPAKFEYFPCVSDGAFGVIIVKDDGRVTLVVGSNNWVSLAGITFRAAGY